MNKEFIVILFITFIFIGFFIIYRMAIYIWEDIDKQIEEDENEEKLTMAKRVAKFEKVSDKRFIQDWQKEFMGSEEWAKVVYDHIKMPQGVFMQYGVTEDDKVEVERNGGFGSTDKKE